MVNFEDGVNFIGVRKERFEGVYFGYDVVYGLDVNGGVVVGGF